ncbi:TetR/AcrR family transcriptional regulator [Methanospirillum sp. J.3.6.1-F.2.7.3]|uniref:TetR/AcrR family transcriptional regulator n=1 Tax=Methanospirillum purgamenti TaxID=2834276 RepID=A0A8E7B1A9_9EURY|nr:MULTISPECIES: TetR/AcrR family transcriptional regulator [Methanospirillum]MDX8550855.1 TetR/AcrR family transcriptional regulator [Methanospirillum hungatei]QVV90154.1 TetR/AcrR family transcriptional regulator [Methanospirillum sp. J.3.6.1-F.2.7.3]
MNLQKLPETHINNEDKRERIVASALHLFTTFGFHATPTSQISKAAHVSTGTLFHYFPDKQTLIDELYLSIKKEMSSVVGNEDNPALPTRTLLERGFIRYIDWGIANPKKARFLTQFHHSPNISDAVQNRAYEEFRWMTDLYSRAIREGIFSNHPVHYHMVMIAQILNGVLELLTLHDGDMSDEAIIAAGIEKIFK